MTYSTLNENNMYAVHKYAQEIQEMVASSEQLIPTISYWALQKSITNLQGLTLLIFPLHGVSETDLAQFMPMFIFVEATIYQIDEEYENHIFHPEFVSPHISVLRNILTELNLFDEAIEKELEEGLIYYSLEQKFCSGGMPTLETIHQSSLFKCFDTGILQRILLKIIDQPYDEEFLSICKLYYQICKICGDIEDYKRDVKSNVINVYRIFIRLYGTEAPHKLQDYITSLNAKLQSRIQLLQQAKPDLAQKFIEMQNKYIEFKKQLLKEEPIDGLLIPEIPEPILEENPMADINNL